jgi:hypothetical protein
VATEEDVNLDDLTKSELQDKADELGVDWSDSDTKAELIDKINEADEPDDDEGDGDDEEGEVIEGDQSGTAITAYTGPVPSEQYPERRPSEPDMADLEVTEADGDFMPPLNAESWVVLDGSHIDVPDWADGRIAAVLSAPSVTVTDPDTGESHEEFPVDGHLTVQERSQGLRLYLPMEAFKEVHSNGRGAVQAFA